MNEFIYNNFKHVLCFLLLISRLGDIISTYLVSPTLKLEANPIARKFGWRFMLLSVLVCLLPYYDAGLAVMALVPSLLVSAANIEKFWMVRAMGEAEYAKMFLVLARKSRLSHALFSILTSSFFIILAGLALLFLCPDPQGWGLWFGIGIILYGFIIALYGSLYLRRLFRAAQDSSKAAVQENDAHKSTET